MHATAVQGLQRALHLCPSSSAAASLQGSRCQNGAETELIHPYGGYPAAKLQKYCMSINAGCPATLARAVACICITLVFVRGHRALLPCYMWLATVPRARPEPPSQSRLTLVSTGARIAAKRQTAALKEHSQACSLASAASRSRLRTSQC